MALVFRSLLVGALAFVGTVGCGLMVAFLIIMAVWSAGELRGAVVSNGWPAASGKVLSSRIESWYESGDTYYQAKVEFEYVVDERRFVSDRVRFGGFVPAIPFESNEASTIATRFQPGASVTVYYDPGDPASAVLEPGVGILRSVLMIGIPIGMGAVFFSSALACAGVVKRRLQALKGVT